MDQMLAYDDAQTVAKSCRYGHPRQALRHTFRRVPISSLSALYLNPSTKLKWRSRAAPSDTGVAKHTSTHYLLVIILWILPLIVPAFYTLNPTRIRITSFSSVG
jgi:hypothetical protein